MDTTINTTTRLIGLAAAILIAVIGLSSCASPTPIISAVDVLRVNGIRPYIVEIPVDAKASDRIEIQVANKDGSIESRTTGRTDWFPGGYAKVFMREPSYYERQFDLLGKYGDLTTLLVDVKNYKSAAILNMADETIHPMGTILAYYGDVASEYPLPPYSLPSGNGIIIRVTMRPATDREIQNDKARGRSVE